MTERDEFDRIVEGLDLDLDLDEIERTEFRAAAPTPPAAPRVDAPTGQDEEFYRVVPPARLRPGRHVLWAWIGVMVAPVVLVVSALLRWPVSMGLVTLVTAVSGASAIYLVWRLPSHGPAQQDWPDDGAAL